MGSEPLEVIEKPLPFLVTVTAEPFFTSAWKVTSVSFLLLLKAFKVLLIRPLISVSLGF
jgi:hypothetical protein